MADQVPEHFFEQSAAIPYRHVDGRLEIALITSRRGKRWVIPKGVIDPGEKAAESAARETLEEAGLAGRIGAKAIGSYVYEKWGGRCRVEVFLMAVERELEEWDESHVRERRWMSPKAAARLVREPKLKRLIQAVHASVDGTDGG